MKTESIARIAHEVNRAYCLSLGDDSQPTWEEAPQWQRDSATAGVEMHLANPDATPEDSHASWLAQKAADGWVYGPTKDAEKKEHPCCVPYDQLPAEQKAKDYLFRGVVHAVKDLPDTAESTGVVAPAAVAGSLAAPSGYVLVKYIGHRENYRDGAYGSGIEFQRGTASLVPEAIAIKLLRHRDVYQLAEGESIAATSEAENVPRDEQDESSTQDLRDAVANMDKEALESFAQTHFNVSLDKRKGVSNLRQQVTGLIDQYGVQ